MATLYKQTYIVQSISEHHSDQDMVTLRLRVPPEPRKETDSENPLQNHQPYMGGQMMSVEHTVPLKSAPAIGSTVTVTITTEK